MMKHWDKEMSRKLELGFVGKRKQYKFIYLILIVTFTITFKILELKIFMTLKAN